MNREWKEKWIAALESGKYQQTSEVLHRSKPSFGMEREFPAGFCCLGVLADIQGAISDPDLRYAGGDEMLSPKFACGLTHTEQSRLAQLNDNGVDFSEIAKHIRDTIDNEDHEE